MLWKWSKADQFTRAQSLAPLAKDRQFTAKTLDARDPRLQVAHRQLVECQIITVEVYNLLLQVT